MWSQKWPPGFMSLPLSLLKLKSPSTVLQAMFWFCDEPCFCSNVLCVASVKSNLWFKVWSSLSQYLWGLHLNTTIGGQGGVEALPSWPKSAPPSHEKLHPLSGIDLILPPFLSLAKIFKTPCKFLPMAWSWVVSTPYIKGTVIHNLVSQPARSQ